MTAALRYLAAGVTLVLDLDRCTGCGACVPVCPHRVLAVEDRKVRAVVRGACIECGACMTNCPAEAIAVRRGVGCAAALANRVLGRGEVCCG
jgi:ferredoxin